VLDFGIPRRVRPCLARVRYSQLLQGQLGLQGQTLRCAPAHSHRLASELAEELCTQLRDGRFPLRLPLAPLTPRAALRPLA